MPELREYSRSFSFTGSTAESGADGAPLTAYETLDGSLQKAEDGSAWTPPGSSGGTLAWPMTIKKTYFSPSPVPDCLPGGTFTVPKNFGQLAFGSDYSWTTLTVRCTSAEVSDEVIRFVPPGIIVRLWEITLEGTSESIGTGGADAITVKRLSADYSTELNGNAERTISGRLILLLNSATPIRKLHLEATGRAFPCPYKAGDNFTFPMFGGGGVPFAIISARTSRNVQERGDGSAIASLYDYALDMEA